MAWWRGRKTLLATGLALLLCTGLALAEDWFFHTDDGCAVEVHCIACRWAHAAAGFAHATVAALAPATGSVPTAPALRPSVPDHDFASPALSRGPPAS